ncbi:chitin synthesis regulation, resistance to congo red-domain-containing protein [Daldinia sp. FL1419]|nr:chitin synthesis regulation, resistance to congo red-domain-containing protein [Daldinia sp. FL1419]
MAPLIDLVSAQLAGLTKRDAYCRNGEYYRYGRCYSGWYWYGRWIFAAIVIVLIIVLLFVMVCVNSRRRKRRGLQPMYGTGWMAGNSGANNNQYYSNQQGYANPPPAYGAPPGQSFPMQNQYTGTTFSPNDGYYGQHEGVQPPKNVYNNNNKDDYAPPAGPPPGR